MFAFEHYGITPDLIACGKGITSSLPLSAVIGRADILGLYAPGSMTSTHSASPLAVAAAIENLKLLRREKLVGRAAKLGNILSSALQRLQRRHPQVLGCVRAKGLVAGIQVVRPGTRDPDPVLAQRIHVACFRKGLLMFAPVGVAGECLKIAPPLTISDAALRESIAVFEEAVDECLHPRT
jgi:4-aminobutyrate aminotransferase-like enzyme